MEAEADEGERLYHLTDRLVAEFRRTGLYMLLTPKELGGLELPFVEAMQLVEQVTYVDGSAGWCMMVEGVMGASLGSSLPDRGARTVFPNGADVTMAGNGVPRGFARPVDDGYQIRGHWAYGSGIYHAEWIHSGCFVMDGENMKFNADGAPEIVLCHHPRSSIELKGNWDVLGLRGTGSYDYTLNGAGNLRPLAYDLHVRRDRAAARRETIQRRLDWPHQLGSHQLGAGRGPAGAR